MTAGKPIPPLRLPRCPECGKQFGRRDRCPYCGVGLVFR